VLLPVLVLFLLLVLDPGASGLFPRCVFHEVTGLHCFGCGGQRAVDAVLGGNVVQALSHNALVVLLLPVLFYSWFKLGMRRLGALALPDIYIKSTWIWGLVIAVALFGILRNLAVNPFTWLAP
jgi:hypothetical protein